MEKRTAQEKEKYQPSYESTILTEVSRPRAQVSCQQRDETTHLEGMLPSKVPVKLWQVPGSGAVFMR